MTRRRGLRVAADDSDEVIAAKIERVRAVGVAIVSGSDSRTLQRVVNIAARNGLEIRDPSGHLLVAADRLNHARDYVRDAARVHHRWVIQINGATVSFSGPLGYRVERFGGNPDGRRVAFDVGAEFDLATNHAL